MKKLFFSCIVPILTLLCFMACSDEPSRQKPVSVELRSSLWSFNPVQPARSTLTAQVPQAELTGGRTRSDS